MPLVTRRTGRRSLTAHHLVLASVLVGLMVVVGWQAPFSADEGAAAAQARLLADGDGWSAPHPFPEADPTGDAFPLARSTETDEGWAPFAKHPTYSLLLSGADRIGGVPAMVLISVLGTVAAAAAAGALAARIDDSLARPALWVTGLASPLMFDAHLLMGHTLAAAAAGGATLCALRAASSRRWSTLAGVAGLTALMVLLRNEAALYAIALALALVIAGVRHRGRGPLVAGIVTGGSGILAMLAEPRLVSWLVPGALDARALEVPGGELGFVAARLQGLLVTWLLPSYGSFGAAEVLLAVAVLAALVGALIVRRRPEDEQGIFLMAGIATCAALARLVLHPGVVPGLVMAFPLLLVAAVLARRQTFSDPTVAVLGVTAALFAGAVLATQYPTGGSGEWGGRYFALALPIAVPVALAVLRQAGAALDGRARHLAAASLVAVTAAIALSGVWALRTVHTNTDRVVSATVSSATDAGPAGDGGGPVVLTTEEALPRLAWDRLDTARWLRVEEEELAAMLARLEGLGVADLTFVTRHEDRDIAILADRYDVVAHSEPVDGSPWVITEAHAR